MYSLDGTIPRIAKRVLRTGKATVSRHRDARDTSSCVGTSRRCICGDCRGDKEGHLRLVVDAETGQSRDALARRHLLEADRAFAFVLGEHVFCNEYQWFWKSA